MEESTMNDMLVRKISLDVIYAKSKVAAQSVAYRGLWEELLGTTKDNNKKEVSNDKLNTERR